MSELRRLRGEMTLRLSWDGGSDEYKETLVLEDDAQDGQQESDLIDMLVLRIRKRVGETLAAGTF